VPDNPQRPFVPHRSPASSRQLAMNSEFQLARPFIPGGATLPSIAEFLDPRDQGGTPVAFVESGKARERFEREDDASDELPPIEHFTDPLPPVMSFAPGDERALSGVDGPAEYTPLETGSRQEDAGWIEDDWQHYDWRAAAALGDGPANEASNEWAATDWDVSPPVTKDRKPNAAEAIASALDEIAQRIRHGELPVPAPDTLANPAAIAASLAALLGVKR
jgi:hypothetical protein